MRCFGVDGCDLLGLVENLYCASGDYNLIDFHHGLLAHSLNVPNDWFCGIDEWSDATMLLARARSKMSVSCNRPGTSLCFLNTSPNVLGSLE